MLVRYTKARGFDPYLECLFFVFSNLYLYFLRYFFIYVGPYNQQFCFFFMTGVKKDPESSGGELMARIGKFVHKFLIKFWIWVVAITLFAVAITGQRMTVFRILYMALFLFFILSFQVSQNLVNNFRYLFQIFNLIKILKI